MNWADAYWLRLLLIPGAGALFLVAMRIARRSESAIRWPGIKRVVAAGTHVLAVPAGRSMRRPWLLLLACTLVVIALARPRWGEIEKPVFQQAREVMIALDLSRSMLVQDVAPDRISRARLLVQSLLDGLRGERVGLLVFAGTAFVQVPLSADYQILNEFLPELNPNYMPQGGTDYAGMLRTAVEGFSEATSTDRYLIILSDGGALDDAWRQRLPDLEKRGVRVIALGVGTADGGFIPDDREGFIKDERGAVVLSRLESETLRQLARETGGAYRDASTWVDLAALLQETVERGRRGDFTEETTVEHIERFQWFLAPAVLLAALGLWREIAVRPRARNVTQKPLRGRGRPRPLAAKPAGAPAQVAMRSLLAGILGFAATIGGPRLLAADQTLGPADGTEAAPANPAAMVRETVARLAAAPRATAADWMEVAQRTLAYGESLRQQGAPLEKGAIHDALAAVEMGERADPALTDWTALRSALEKLLEEPPKPEDQQDQQDQQQQQPQDEEQQEQENEQDKSGDSDQPQDQQSQNQEGEPGDEDSESDSEPSQDQQQQDPSQQQQPQDPSPQDQQNSGSQQQQQQQSQQQPAPEEGRLGDLDDPADESGDSADEPPQPPGQPAPEPRPPQPTRKIGGKPADNRGEPPSDPEMAAALQRLREATDDDSPARLFELLEGEKADNAAGGKDW